MKLKTALTAAAIAAFLLIARLGSADAPAPVTAALQGDPARPASAQHWVRSELYFGIGPVEVPDGGVGEMKWRAFLDREVTPRFQGGLTVLDAYGQWRGGGSDVPSPSTLQRTSNGKKNVASHKSPVRSAKRRWP